MQILTDVMILLMLSAAVLMDFRYYKVTNRLSVTILVTGIVFHMLLRGITGLVQGIGGAVLPFLVLLPLYALSMIGAADIKLFMAVGAYVGVKGSIFVIAAAFVAGAVFSLALMLKYGILFKRLSYLISYIFRIRHGDDLSYYPISSPKQGETLHFSLCITLSYAAYCILFYSL